MKDDELLFESLKEARDWYFVEYAPPIEGNPFAIVQLTILSDKDSDDHARIASNMEKELLRWIQRYAVPVMVSTFNAVGDLICLEPEKPSSHLMGRTIDLGEVETVWGAFESSTLSVLSPKELRTIYHDIPFRTAEQIRFEASKDLALTKRSIRLSLAMLILWLVVIPVSIELLGTASPLIGRLVLIYSLWKAFVQLMKLLGKWPQTQRVKEKAVDDLAKNHHHYHCKKNPEGFIRLKIENFEREERERTLKEAEELKAT